MADNENKTTSKNSSVAQDPSRRRFIKNTGFAAGGVVGGSLLGGLIGNPFKSDEGVKEEDAKMFSEARMFFKRYEDFVVLAEATERIFPEDDNGPGAIGLDVPYYIDKQLAGPWGMNANEYIQGPFYEGEPNQGYQTSLKRSEIFTIGIKLIKDHCKKEYDAKYVDLEAEQKDDVLTALEADDIKMVGVKSSLFFELLRDATLEGAYADPLYGGNKNMAGWKMKDYPGVQMSYTDKVESKDFIEVKPKSLSEYE